MERGILVQRSMGPRLIIVGSVDADEPAQVRFTEHDDVVQALPAPRQPDEQQTIGVVEGRSLWRPAPEHVDLLAKNQDLRFTPRAGLEQTSSPILQNLVFGTHTPLTAASTLTKSKVCADHPFVRSAAHTQKPNGGAMPPGYSSRDDRCGIVRVAA